MARQFLIWETDEDLLARDWVAEIARDIWCDLLWALPHMMRLAFWSGFVAWMIMMWIV
jgi:hypothetical protein